VRIEQAYKGNLHLLATIDGKERKYVIRTNSDSYNEIIAKGISNLSELDLRELVNLYL
jgi:serine/threonine-protein kinase HipA